MTDLIQCPECNRIQGATIQQTMPFLTYIHHCVQCGYIIMEGDWQRVGFNEWAIYVHTEASKVHPALLDYIVTPRVNQSHLEKVLNARN